MTVDEGVPDERGECSRRRSRGRDVAGKQEDAEDRKSHLEKILKSQEAILFIYFYPAECKMLPADWPM